MHFSGEGGGAIEEIFFYRSHAGEREREREQKKGV